MNRRFSSEMLKKPHFIIGAFFVFMLIVLIFYYKHTDLLPHYTILVSLVGNETLNKKNSNLLENKVFDYANSSEDLKTILITNNTCNYDKKRGPRILCTVFTTRGSHTKVMSYEVPSSTEWNHGAPFVPNCFVDVTGFESKKIAALRIAYSEELRSGNHPRSLELILKQMRVNGSVCCVAYAERFEIVKEVM